MGAPRRRLRGLAAAPGAVPVTAVLVLGVGNPLLADDGTGLVLLEGVRARGPWPRGVELADGGTDGLALLPALADASGAVVLDAVRTGGSPGTVHCARDDAVPRLYARPVSPHQVGVGEVLAAAALSGCLPPRLALVGIEPLRTGGPCLGLSPPVVAALGHAVDLACAVVRGWGTQDGGRR